jgi:hypothetical protein
MAHWALATQKKPAYLGFQCLVHPPYSPDLAPSDYYHLFPGLKNQLKREVGWAKDLSAPRYNILSLTRFINWVTFFGNKAPFLSSKYHLQA